MTDIFVGEHSAEGWDEFFRIIEVQEITNDGIYLEDNVPDGYAGGGVLTVQVVHSVFLHNQRAKLTRMNFTVPEPRDKNEQIGGVVLLDNRVIVEEVGPGTTPRRLKRLFTDTGNDLIELAISYGYLRSDLTTITTIS